METKQLKTVMWHKEPEIDTFKKYIYLENETNDYYLRAFLDVKCDKCTVEVWNDESNDKVALTDNQFNLVYNYLTEKYDELAKNVGAFTVDDFIHFNNLRFK